MNKKMKYLIPVIPFTDMVVAKGQGSYIFDTDGNEYLDLNSGQFCAIFGHSNYPLINKINANSDKLIHTASNIIAEEVLFCAENINRISYNMNAYSIILSTGSEVIEFCLRYAKHIKKKTGILCFDKGYHGLTLGSQTVTYSGVYAKPIVKDIYPFPIPDTFIDKTTLEQMANNFEKILAIHDNIAAVLMEPVVSVGGMVIPPSKWFHYVREICDKYNVLLIFDECQTGFGRVGNWFAYQKYDVVPDMVACAKGIGQGYPVAIAMFRDILIPDKTFEMTHYSSHQNDPFAANIINRGIEYIEDNNILEQIKYKGDYFKRELLKLEELNGHIKNARGCGLMLGIDLFFEGVEDYRSISNLLYKNMLTKNIIIQTTNAGKTLRFLPSYLIELSEIDLALNTLNDASSAIQ